MKSVRNPLRTGSNVFSRWDFGTTTCRFDFRGELAMSAARRNPRSMFWINIHARAAKNDWAWTSVNNIFIKKRQDGFQYNVREQGMTLKLRCKMENNERVETNYMWLAGECVERTPASECHPSHTTVENSHQHRK